MNSVEHDKNSPDRLTIRNVALGSPSGLLAFGFGSGLSPLAPGTMGTLVAIPFAFVLKGLDTPVFWATLLLMFILGVFVCERVSHKLGVHDHGGIVWDEMVGYWLAVAFIPWQWQWLMAAFFLFRFFDIYKPWPIRQIDAKVTGGLGIMIDDVVAAVFTVIVLAGVRYLW